MAHTHRRFGFGGVPTSQEKESAVTAARGELSAQVSVKYRWYRM